MYKEKKMKKEYKIFKDGTVKEVMTRAIKEGYRILNYKETRQAIKDGKVKDQWYDTATVIIEDEEHNLSFQDADNELLLKVLNRKIKGRVVVLDLNYYGVNGYYIDDDGCSVGVKVAESSDKYCSKCGKEI